MSVVERLINWFQFTYYDFVRRYWLLPELEKISKLFFGYAEPTLQELERRIAVVLSNEHFSINYPKPTVPAVISVAGLHIKPAKPLPQVSFTKRL